MKNYWENPQDKDEYKKFWDKYKEISVLKDANFVEYVKQKEVLFIKNDLKKVYDEPKTDYTKIIKYYKRKLIDYGEIRVIKNSYKSEGKYIKTKKVAA